MNKKKNTNKGITLIALIITVIVLLILAGTAISIAINGGDIFGKASQAREGWNSAVAEEQEKIDDVMSILNTVTGGNNGGGANPTPTPEALPAEWGATAATYVASAYPSSTVAQKAPIPKGFVASSATGENAIATGLVIYKGTEAVTDANVATAQTSRDQYVWIPVDNSSTITWAKETEDTTLLDDDTGTGVDETKEAGLTLSTDFNAMKTSVQTYGGFYISRYELGGTVSNPTSVKGQEVLTAWESSANQWYGLYDVAHKDITDGTNIVLKGHMIFASEYAKVLDFIDSNNTGYSTTPHRNKQQTVLHASGIIAEGQTGKEIDIVKNIVDLEGNLNEWTAQAANSRGRRIRGGDYTSARNGDINNNINYFNSASFSYYDFPSNVRISGVRQALYVTL